MDMRQMTEMGRKIENGSFAVIDQEIGEHSWPDRVAGGTAYHPFHG